MSPADVEDRRVMGKSERGNEYGFAEFEEPLQHLGCDV